MDERWLRRGLWLSLLVLLPLPSFGIQTAVIPALRQWGLVAVTALFLALESTGGIGPLVLAILAAQALLGSGLLWLVAWGLVRGARRLPASQRPRLLAALVLLAVLLAAAIPVYRTPYSSVAARSTLAQVYR